MSYDVRFYPGVSSDKKNLDPPVWERVEKAIEFKLLKKPEYFGEPLRGTLKEFWKLRVGDYRVGYYIEHELNEIHVVAVGHRKNIYQQMKRRL